MKKIILFLAGLMTGVSLSAQIIHVPADFPTIQAAIDTAANGDTVLVSPGTYAVNLSIDSKNITLASEYLTTGDTAYISQTILDGGGISNTLMVMNSGLGMRISGFTITNGMRLHGGGIFCENSDVKFDHLIISYNSAFAYRLPGCGGGVYVASGNITISNSVICSNYSSGFGGAIYNIGELTLSDVSITGNSSTKGGGIYVASGSVRFDSIHRCNLYDNSSKPTGNDICSVVPVHITVDTFSVLSPNRYFAEPLSLLTFDILHGRYPQYEADLYVSPHGNDSNSGLDPGMPLKTIYHGFSVMLADSLHPHSLNLAQGAYGPALNGEYLPIDMPDYVSLNGTTSDQVTLECGYLPVGCFMMMGSHGNKISGMTILGAEQSFPTSSRGLIYCENSSPELHDLKFTGNYGPCFMSVCSSPVFNQIVMTGNHLFCGSSAILLNKSTAVLDHVIISDNLNGGAVSSDSSQVVVRNSMIRYNMQSTDCGGAGGGFTLIRSSLSMDSVIVEGNSTDADGGGIYADTSIVLMRNVTIRENQGKRGGGIAAVNHSVLSFDSAHTCNIYANRSVEMGNDLFSSTRQNVILDVATLEHPTDLYYKPLKNFTYDILHWMTNLTNADLFISPSGDDDNSGLSADEPLKSIAGAISSVWADSLHPRIIHLANGTYGKAATGERFPLIVPAWITLEGESQDGVILDGADSTTLISLVENSAGGVTRCTLKSGQVTEGLAGFGTLYCSGSSPVIDHVTISKSKGYGIYIDGSSVRMDDVTIRDGRMRGLYCTNSAVIAGNLALTGNGFSDYLHQSGGGACFLNSSVEMDHLSVIDNKNWGTGCGIFLENSNVRISQALIKGNRPIYPDQSSRCGGGICLSGSDLTLDNVTIDSNVSCNGGGIYATSHSAVRGSVLLTRNKGTEGGGIFCGNESECHLESSTIADNISLQGAALDVESGAAFLLTNSILWDPGQTEVKATPGDLSITYSDIRGGWPGEGNTEDDPLFDSTGVFRYALAASSPCINSGTPDTAGLNIPATDFAGNQRIFGGRIDMGVYEWNNVGHDDLRFTNDDFGIRVMPNPVSDNAVFVYTLKKTAQVTLTLYDNTGKQVAILVNGQQPAGIQKVSRRASDLSSGIYLIRLSIDGSCITGKMIVSR